MKRSGFIFIAILFSLFLVPKPPVFAQQNNMLCSYCPELCGGSSGTQVGGEFFKCEPGSVNPQTGRGTFTIYKNQDRTNFEMFQYDKNGIYHYQENIWSGGQGDNICQDTGNKTFIRRFGPDGQAMKWADSTMNVGDCVSQIGYIKAYDAVTGNECSNTGPDKPPSSVNNSFCLSHKGCVKFSNGVRSDDGYVLTVTSGAGAGENFYFDSNQGWIGFDRGSSDGNYASNPIDTGPEPANCKEAKAPSPRSIPRENSRVEPYRGYPDQSAENCPPSESAGDRSSAPGNFQLFPFLPTQPEMRSNAGVNMNGAVRGAHCGQAKSEPIVLHETAKFPLSDSPFCKTVKWAGNITIKDGVAVPFAQELADQWAGRWDAEHFEESYINDLEEKRRNIGGKYTADVEEAARREIEVNTGVLKKILPKQRIDELTCDTIKYVKRKGSRSAFANFTVNGHKITDIPCAPIVNSARDLTSRAAIQLAYDKWVLEWGDTWRKLPLFPDEQAIGQLRFAVCDDKTYNTYGTFPEVFRLGMAASEIFKIIKPEADIRKMSKAGFGDVLDKPYTSNKLSINTNSPDNFVDGLNFAAKNGQLPIKQKEYTVDSSQQRTVQTDLINSLKNSIAAFWQKIFPINKPLTPAIAASADSPSDKLLAAAEPGQGGTCFSIGVEYSGETLNSDGSMDVNVRPVLINSVVGEGGGHIQYYINGVSQGTQIPWNTSPEEGSQQIWLPPVRVTVGAGGTSGISVGAKIDECGKGNFNQLGCTFSVKDGKPTSSCGQFAPAGPRCDPNVQCCPGETRTCAAVCANCSRAQLGPSFTTGAFTGSSKTVGIGDPEVAFSFNVPAGTPKNLPPGCEEVETERGRIIIQCRRGHTRVVDVYANVPFLDSIWKQSAGATNGVGGFFYAFKPFMTEGQSIPTRRGCSGAEEFVFTKDKQFADQPGASEVSYEFPTVIKDDVRVDKVSGNPQKLIFYKIGGVCNANRWVSAFELMPNKAVNPFYFGPTTAPAPSPTPSKKQ